MLHFFTRNEKVRAEMSGWGLEFSESLVSANGRMMPPEMIFQKSAKV